LHWNALALRRVFSTQAKVRCMAKTSLQSSRNTADGFKVGKGRLFSKLVLHILFGAFKTVPCGGRETLSNYNDSKKKQHFFQHGRYIPSQDLDHYTFSGCSLF
jgi:hypothetical protein